MREKTRGRASYKPTDDRRRTRLVSLEGEMLLPRSLARSCERNNLHSLIMFYPHVASRSLAPARALFNFHCLIIVIYSQLLIIMAKLQLPEKTDATDANERTNERPHRTAELHCTNCLK